MSAFDRRHLQPIAMAIVLLLISLRLGTAQTFSSTVVGRVTDATGGVLPGATIELVHKETGAVHTGVTGGEGSFMVASLPPGEYELRAGLSGYRRTVRPGIRLETGQTQRVNVALELGGVEVEVTVRTTLPVLNTDTSSKGEVITPRQVEELPLNGRDYTDLALLAPGVYRRPADDDQAQGLAASGTRTDASNFVLDGSVNRQDRTAGSGVNISLDAIQEFSVRTSSYSAEYGRTAGVQVNVVSKAGGNKFRGSAFEYLRDGAFDAKNFFADPAQESTLKRHQLGGSLGGPIFKNRTFFFASYEGTLEKRTVSQLTTAPNAAWLQGDFRNVRGAGPDGVLGNADDTNRIVDPVTRGEFPTPNVIPASRFHPAAQKMLAFLPAANRAGTLDGYATTGQDDGHNNKLSLRIDHSIGNSDRLDARWARQIGGGYDPFPSNRNFYPGFGRDSTSRKDALTMGDSHFFSSQIMGEVRVGLYDQHNENLGQNRDRDWITEFGIPGLSPLADQQGWPAIRIDGFSEFGDRPNDPFIYDVQNLQFQGTIIASRGSHGLKFGFDSIRSNYVETDVRNVRGDFRFRGRNTNPAANSTSTGFRSFADFLLGLPDSTQRQLDSTPADLVGWQHALFIQDDWRIHPRLTLNLGLRYEMQTALTEKENRISNFVPGLGEVVSGDPRLPKGLVDPDRNNIGPRLGFAWRPTDGNRLVIRGGAGIYYSLETFNPIRQQLAVKAPFVSREQYSRDANNRTLLSFSNPYPTGRGAVDGVSTPFGLQVDYQTPELYQYNLTLERELMRDLAIEIGYVGSQGRHLGRRYNLNQPRVIGLSATNTPVTERPYPQYGDIQYQTQTASSSYNALQVAARRRSAGGLTMLVSYTFSRAIDDASSTNNSTTGTQKFPQNVYNLAAERGLADFHRQHQFAASFNYDLPFGEGRHWGAGMKGLSQAVFGGWQVNGIVTVLSGRPFTPQYAAADVGQQRPDRVGDPRANIPAGLAFNPAAFARPQAADDGDFYGNAGRNILIGPGFQNVDLSLFKTFTLKSRLRLQFRTEVFNILNHPNFQVPVFLLDNTNVGTYTSTASNAREMQFALKLLF